jgi:lysophospholipase L1-like esterase
MTDDLSDDQPWNDPQIPTGLNSRRVYTRAVAVGGARRRRRRQRRTIGVTVLCLLALAPIVGLAARKAHDPQVVVAGHGATSTTAGQPTTIPAKLTSQILAIGDSVMLGAQDSLRADIPGVFVDANVSRQFWDATSVLQQYKTEGLLPPTIIVDVGTNGAFSDAQFAHMMSVVGGYRTIFFVNVREPRTWETEVNQRLATNVQEYPNAHLIDWHEQGNLHPDWFLSDGIHLSASGASGYALLIRHDLLGVPMSPTTTSTLPTAAATNPTTTNAPTTSVPARGVVRIVTYARRTLPANQQVKLRATAILANGRTKIVKATWSVSDPTIAPITPDGLFGQSLKSGTVIVTASYQPSSGGPPITVSTTVVVSGPSCTTFTVANSPITGAVC